MGILNIKSKRDMTVTTILENEEESQVIDAVSIHSKSPFRLLPPNCEVLDT